MSEVRDTTPSASTVPGKRAPRGHRGQVVIYETWCKGCGLCVAFCPVHVLALDVDGFPVVASPEKCTACRWCDVHCPDLAIVVKSVDESSEQPEAV